MCLSLCVYTSSFSLFSGEFSISTSFRVQIQAIVNSTKVCSRNHNLCLFSTRTRRCVNTCYLPHSSSVSQPLDFWQLPDWFGCFRASVSVHSVNQGFGVDEALLNCSSRKDLWLKFQAALSVCQWQRVIFIVSNLCSFYQISKQAFVRFALRHGPTATKRGLSIVPPIMQPSYGHLMLSIQSSNL